MGIARMRTAALAALMVPLLVTGCAGGGGNTSPTPTADSASDSDLKALIDAAKSEGSLLVYGSWADGPLQEMVKAFGAEYGINASFVRLNSAGMAQRAQAEFDANAVQADILWASDSVFFKHAATQGITIPLEDAEIPSLANVPVEYRIDDNTVVSAVGSGVAIYNTDLISDPPTEWADLLDPALKGKIVMVDPRTSATYLNTWNAVYEDPKLGPKFLEAFAAQGYAQVADSSVSGAQLVAAGEGVIAVPLVQNVVKTLTDQGAPVDSWTFANPSPALFMYIAATAGSQHPNAAKLFVNWVMTEKGSTVVNRAGMMSSPLGDLPGVSPMSAGTVPPNDAAAKANASKILKLLGF